jgi:type IV pilus assembly protein PilC
MKFKYKVYDRNNTLQIGELEADSSKQAQVFLAEQGYEVLSLESIKEVKKKRDLEFSSYFGSVSLEQKMLFIKHLSLMIKSGMPINEAITILVSEHKGLFKRILQHILASIEGGNNLTDSLAKYPRIFDKFFISMVQIGEESGSLEQSLVNLALHLRKTHELRSKIQSALLYPTIVVSAMFGLGITLAIFVLPKLTTLFASLGSDLPLTTKMLLATSNFLTHYWYVSMLSAIIFVVVILITRQVMPTKLFFHWAALHVPLIHRFGLVLNLSSMCRAMSLLLQSGVTVDKALEIVQGNLSNIFYRRDVSYFLQQIKKGESLGESMKHSPKRFPGLVSKMIKVGEQSGNLAETFAYLADYYEEDLDSLSRNLSSILEPVLLVFIGIIVAFVAMAVISPIYNFTSNVGN